ncbi:MULTISPECIES: OB-fold domain-containing protein [unclassified Caballeronia]|uniref:Zn-ribbon domain-containing OB-fold protein n=1 Tax=unclassified Caballeronia TaxID=2646786 RepID=UPI0028561BCE|nr:MULTISPECIES: OB-fold domain-containing protein [unclassified Caballeronia]MDR5777163.1 OB-fold domain-containing protein [Caballeronia sp. LZ002]MDR5852612.1 OB-fold domain-containing protein [Caballeronia sp. LZ003]
MGAETRAIAGGQYRQPEKEFIEHLSAGRFMLPKETVSGRFIFPPRVAEPLSGRTSLEWHEASGRGTVYAVTVVHPKAPDTPYNVALIDLAEGPRLMSRVIGVQPDEVVIGMPVMARIIEESFGKVLVFEAISGGAQA